MEPIVHPKGRLGKKSKPPGVPHKRWKPFRPRQKVYTW